uniref:aECM cysteine-cradle domain-containing protein n=1 Tax=Parascaris univalens TaxID=6257 RepID=A0A914ZEK5_PARUN
MRIDRLHELNKGDEQKKELERREQITKQLEQLAESERKQHELIAQQEMALRMKEKAVKMAVLKATQNTSNAPLKRDPASLLHSIPVTVNRPTPQPTVTPSRADGMQLSRAQCEAIRKFARVFQMANPAEWVRENCPFAKQYFPRASCSQIQLLFESCMLRT